ncbi:hypothetical protein J2789_000697 [Variovorax paradoxus]|uniref:hypothetical protein n=1 Tax=Variovorax atrisoli TaxID=3394203 RepID=UPI001199F749|nr:hypothetical protein [Variovorax paradoxus]MDR6518035.1 hypothetical protein [Variovorax paradoxus]
MAASARTSARISSAPTASVPRDIESLALEVCDDIESLRPMQRAYACLEKLIVQQEVNDAQELYPSRAELAALVGVVNDELQRRIDAAEATAQSLRHGLGRSGTP